MSFFVFSCGYVLGLHRKMAGREAGKHVLHCSPFDLMLLVPTDSHHYLLCADITEGRLCDNIRSCKILGF